MWELKKTVYTRRLWRIPRPEWRELIFWLNYFELMARKGEREREEMDVKDLRDPAETWAHTHKHTPLSIFEPEIILCRLISHPVSLIIKRYFIDGRKECNLVFHRHMHCVCVCVKISVARLWELMYSITLNVILYFPDYKTPCSGCCNYYSKRGKKVLKFAPL